MVIEWSEWTDARAATEWDLALQDMPGHSFYQSYAWGEYKRRGGWTPRRATVVIDAAPAAMAQCLVREIPWGRMAAVWVPGALAGSRAGLLALGKALHERYRGWRLWVRINAVREVWPSYDADLSRSGWRQARRRVGHPVTFQLDLARDASKRRAALSQNWRHNLVRGEQRGGLIRSWDSRDSLDRVYAVYRETAERKGLNDQISLADLEALRGVSGSAFNLVVAIDEAGEPTAMRGFMRFADRADDFVSGVSENGRHRYANYLLTWHLLELARERGVRTYDLGGADAVGAAGVYGFKRGLGGREVALVGEWEWQNSRWLGWAVGRAIAERRRKPVPA